MGFGQGGDEIAEVVMTAHVQAAEENGNRNPIRCKSSPRILNKESTAQDITAIFRSAASGLTTGQLVKNEFFTLLEAVGALEIMDPKMDSGFLAQGESLDDDYDVLRELLPEEVIGIIDQLICFEVAWHMGHPLSQSLFTSSYIDRLLWPEPRTLQQACFDRGEETGQGNLLLHLVLRSYCLALLKTCDFVLVRMGNAQYFEEEDFVTHLYHRKLLSDFEVSDIERLLEDALAWLRQPEGLCTDGLQAALSNRIEFRKAFLSAMKLENPRDGPSQIYSWENCLEVLPSLLETKELGVSVDTSFSTKVQRRLANTVPPRPIVKISFQESYLFLYQMCENGKEIFRAIDCPDGNSWLNFVWTFLSRTPYPCVYIRGLLQSLITNYTTIGGAATVKNFIYDDLAQMVLPASLLIDPANDLVEVPHDPRFRVARKLDAFILRAGEAYLELFQALCMNRSRMRRVLCHLILLWDGVQLDAEALDIDVRVYTNERPIRERKTKQDIWSFPLSSWAYYHKLHQMEWVIQLGFELDIYQLDELAGMYWYLQYLASTRLEHLERIQMFTTHAYSRISKPTVQESAAFSRSYSFLKFAMLEASAVQSFADGLSQLYSFLAYLGLLPYSYESAPYSTPSLRYSLRMRPFLPIASPKVPSYSDFTSSISPRPTAAPTDIQQLPHTTALITQASSILDITDQTLREARKEWDAVSKTDPKIAQCMNCEDWWKSSVRDVVRACITGNIAVATVKKGLTNSSPKEAKDVFTVMMPEKEKRHHAWWVVPSISVK